MQSIITPLRNFIAPISADNPFVTQQARQDARRIPKRRGLFSLLFYWGELLLAFSLVIYRVYTLFVQDSVLTNLSPDALVAINTVQGVFTLVILISHFQLMIQTLVLASSRLVADRAPARWDILILTGVRAKAITNGVWWTVVRQQYPRYLRLGVLRACLVVVWITTFPATFFTIMNYSSTSTFISADAASVIASLAVLALTIGLTILFTLVDLLSTAAFGIYGAARAQRGGTAMTFALFVRGVFHLVLPFFLFMGLLWFGFSRMFYSASYDLIEVYQTVQLVFLSFVDGGSIGSVLTVTPDWQFISQVNDVAMYSLVLSLNGYAAIALLVAFALHVLLARVMLRAAAQAHRAA
jgi:hypothetical protein